MLKIHTRDGATTNLDLKDENQAKEWLRRIKQTAFQESVTGITILQKCSGKFRCPQCNRSRRLVCSYCGRREDRACCDKSIQYSLPRPDGFGQIFYHAEDILPEPMKHIRGGEKITCFVDDIRATLMVHREQPAARVSLLKTGKQRYNPLTE